MIAGKNNSRVTVGATMAFMLRDCWIRYSGPNYYWIPNNFFALIVGLTISVLHQQAGKQFSF